MTDGNISLKKGLFQLIFRSFKKKIENQKLHICKLL
jgi:hypothetical protein